MRWIAAWFIPPILSPTNRRISIRRYNMGRGYASTNSRHKGFRYAISSAIGTTNFVAPDFNPAGKARLKCCALTLITDNLPKNTDKPAVLMYK